MKSKAIPEPDRKEACLPSAGLNHQRATKHTFVEAVPGIVKFPHTTRSCFFFIFRCSETGALRRFGYQ